jgi:hypothetical protein
MRFRTPDAREAAMRRQPFVLDGATVKLLRDGETPDIRRASNGYIVHAALRQYPVEQRTRKKIEGNCNQLGHVREIDPACFAAPHLATVRVVLQLEDPGDIAHELRIEYRDGSISVVPVEIVGVRHYSVLTLLQRQWTVCASVPATGSPRLMDFISSSNKLASVNSVCNLSTTLPLVLGTV